VAEPMDEYTWSSMWGIVAAADDIDIGYHVLARNKDGIKREVVVEAIQYFEAKSNGRLMARCLVAEVNATVRR